MEDQTLADVNSPESVRTGVHSFGDWLSVQEAVAYCQIKGLARTAKTVRKWAYASLSAADGAGDVVVQRQDTGNGFRYLVSRISLDVKINQEKAFDEHTGAHRSAQVHTSVHLSPPVLASNEAAEMEGAPENFSTPMHTGANAVAGGYVTMLEKQLERAHQQIDVKDKQIDALLERDRETNILIQGLQTSLSGVVNALPSVRSQERGDQETHPSMEHA